MDTTSASRGGHRDSVVLSGGAARGAVHVGMLGGLIDETLPDALIGRSVGALGAAFVGWHPDVERVRELRHNWSTTCAHRTSAAG